jgi:hypothetical protein
MSGHIPKIGKNVFVKQTNDLSDQEIDARKAAGIEPDAPLTESEIAAREEAKAALLRSATPVEPEPPVIAATPLGARLDEIAAAQRGATRKATAAQVAEATALARPLLEESRALTLKAGALRSEHKSKVMDVARRPWSEILKAIPNTMTYAERPALVSENDGESLGAERASDGLAGAHLRPQFISNKFYVSELARIARDLDGALANSFPDLVAAATEVAQYIGRGPERRGIASEYGEQFEAVLGVGTHDLLYGTLSPDFRRALTHLRVHVERARGLLAATEGLLVQFAKIQERAESILANVGIEPVAALPKLMLSELQHTSSAPSRVSSDWDPRDPSTYTPTEPPAPSQVRMGDASEREKKVIGIVGNQS